MTISPFELYVLLKLDSIRGFFFVASILSCFGVLVCARIGYGDGVEKARRLVGRLAITTMLLAIITVLLPNTKEAAVILVLPKIVNSDFVQKVLPKESLEVYELAKKWLREHANESGDQR